VCACVVECGGCDTALESGKTSESKDVMHSKAVSLPQTGLPPHSMTMRRFERLLESRRHVKIVSICICG
jgi:hypothetical protein